MRLTVHTFVTLDGVMQGPGGPDEDRSNGFAHGGWLMPAVDDDFNRIVTSWFENADALLLGRTTYGLFAGFWPDVTDPDDPVAAALNSLPKHVASTTLTDPTWANTSVLEGDVVAAVRALKEQPGRELQVHGSCGLVHTLHDAGLVDEYRLLVAPVVVGSGKKLFPDGAAPTGFELVSSERTGAGCTYLVLRPIGEVEVAEATIEDGKDVIR
ncbi:MAG TPA: dihydrofolate reductase family protein [Lapillicoccus sp.]|nr:dihydrofolate reductase family protein [Lapillicoccus sp.]